jgi:hypothetical protein
MKIKYLILIIIGTLYMTLLNLGHGEDYSRVKKADTFLLNNSVTTDWRIVNDTVMGGQSTSQLKRSPQDDTWIFVGKLSLENNGGFASIRSPQEEYDFRDYKGIEIKVRGDGKNYGISLSEDYNFTGFYYHYSFSTRPNDWMIHQLNFDQFKPQYFGKHFEYSRKVDLDDIKEIALIIGDKQSGSFQLEIAWIKLIPRQ